jgi:hypothetical protein
MTRWRSSGTRRIEADQAGAVARSPQAGESEQGNTRPLRALMSVNRAHLLDTRKRTSDLGPFSGCKVGQTRLAASRYQNGLADFRIPQRSLMVLLLRLRRSSIALPESNILKRLEHKVHHFQGSRQGLTPQRPRLRAGLDGDRDIPTAAGAAPGPNTGSARSSRLTAALVDWQSLAR